MSQASRAGLDPGVIELLQALPVAAVVVGGDRRLVAGNRLLSDLFSEAVAVIEQRGAAGELMRCVNAITRSEGCGHTPACASCLMKQTADRAIAGERIAGLEVRIKSQHAGGFQDQVFLISGGPYRPEGTEVRALLLVQEVTELHRLRGLVPICASCKKIRGSDEDWQRLEKFIEEHSYASFTHSVCPECAARLYPESSAAG